MSTIVLPSKHRSLETAYLQDWPFGISRCIRAIWVETHKTRGQRTAYATSKKFLTTEYEDWKAKTEQQVTSETIRDVFGGSLHAYAFNKPKYSTYHAIAFYVHDESGADGPRTWIEGVTLYDTLAEIRNLRGKYLYDKEQLERFDELIAKRSLH